MGNNREYVAIIGSRTFDIVRSTGGNKWIRELERVMASLPKDAVVISGGCRGVDQIAANTARSWGIHVAVIDALWSQHGKAAGPIRNQVLVDMVAALGGRLVAFWDGISRGTVDTVNRARKAGVDVQVIQPGKEAAE